MEFWIFVLAVWLGVEWLRRRHYQRKNDERFANLVDGLNRVQREISELKKSAARVTELEKRPAAPEAGAQSAATVATPPAQEPRVSATLHGPAPTVAAQLPRLTPPISPPSPAEPAPPSAPPPAPAPPAQAV